MLWVMHRQQTGRRHGRTDGPVIGGCVVLRRTGLSPDAVAVWQEKAPGSTDAQGGSPDAAAVWEEETPRSTDARGSPGVWSVWEEESPGITGSPGIAGGLLAHGLTGRSRSCLCVCVWEEEETPEACSDICKIFCAV